MSGGPRFVVDGRVFDHFPGMRIPVAVALGINNRPAAAIDELLGRAWTEAGPEATAHGNAQSHPRVRPWREHFRALGVSGQKYPSSIEALLRRAGKVPQPPRINPLVDFYNAISLAHIVPAGGFDLDSLSGDLRLRMTDGGEPFLALDAAESESVGPGEVAYTDDSDVLTRHLVWRQAVKGLIRPETENAVLLSEVLGEVEPSVADEVAAAFTTGLATHLGVRSETSIVDAGNAAIALRSRTSE